MTFTAALALTATVLSAPAAVAAAPPEGAYWHTRAVTTSTHPWRFGTRSHPYALLETSVTEEWTTPAGKAWHGYRELATRPASPADKKAWQRDGSPARWGKSIDGKIVKLSGEHSKGHVGPVRQERDQFRLAEQWLTYEEVQRLPADPELLRDWLTRAARVSRVPEKLVESWVTSVLPSLLHRLPAPKEVRAAAREALLKSPNVRAGGAAKDSLGRSGAVVVINQTHETRGQKTVIQHRLIIDTGRMVLLAQSQKATHNGKPAPDMSYDETLTRVGWTNSPPTVPALP
ncbi:hypothetical protein OUY22_09185 [Nonomuraea sp. MCN248]|uniref:CU044_5270 family protein n=1 Tax=Nonomuraea corallina TaxID=2989783 RepID=A0ABT4S8T7_9ACTN|nr:hypothetical protein [Nonomuraea corallina]MDA0633591.1 hypothetical protein [Nonomuraea corallina]